jgi:amidase
MDRRDLLRLAAAGAALAAPVRHVTAQAALPPDLAEASVASLGALMQTGAQSAVSISERYFARMDAIDRAGPAVNAVIERNPDALAIAEALDRERRDKGPRGPLHGVPVLIKDNIDTGDRMRTSAGSLALAERRAARDAFVVERPARRRLRDPRQDEPLEWANIRSTRSTSGWSARGGPDAQPLCARSQHEWIELGIGRAIAAISVLIAVGTETDGSITSPSSCCGLVGLKPTSAS